MLFGKMEEGRLEPHSFLDLTAIITFLQISVLRRSFLKPTKIQSCDLSSTVLLEVKLTTLPIKRIKKSS